LGSANFRPRSSRRTDDEVFHVWLRIAKQNFTQRWSALNLCAARCTCRGRQRGDSQSKGEAMKPTSKFESTQAPPDRPNRIRKLRATALVAAFALGATTLLLGVSPVARALAMQAGNAEGTSLFEQMHGGAHSPAGMHDHFEAVLGEAGVDGARKKEIHDIMKEAMTAQHADMSRFHDTCSQLKTLLTADGIDDAAIARVRAEQDRLALAASHRLSDTMVAVAKVLTPAQRAKLGAEIDRMIASSGAHHHGD
jgi:Spy/CpxP family protein refolding chaperone